MVDVPVDQRVKSYVEEEEEEFLCEINREN
jgi:hypothetical protein